MALLDGSGTLDLKRNWLRPGWVPTFGVLTGTILDGTDLVAGQSPGFVDEAGKDFRLLDLADSIDRATVLPAAVMVSHPVEHQYVPHQSAATRPSSGTPDLGAYEFAATSPCDFNGDATADALDLQRLINTILLSVPLAGSDINRDGRTDVVDLQLLANVVLGGDRLSVTFNVALAPWFRRSSMSASRPLPAVLPLALARAPVSQ